MFYIDVIPDEAESFLPIIKAMRHLESSSIDFFPAIQAAICLFSGCFSFEKVFVKDVANPMHPTGNNPELIQPINELVE